MTFPAAVPEIRAANVDKAFAYYVDRLGFTIPSAPSERHKAPRTDPIPDQSQQQGPFYVIDAGLRAVLDL